MIKTVIIEDESEAVVYLQRLLHECDSGVEVVQILNSVKEAINYLACNEPELIFLDINLSDNFCFEIFEKVEIRCPIIFTTAYSEYAIKAFEQNSIDYLLKPISRTAVEKSITKFLNLGSPVLKYKEILNNPDFGYKKRFLVRINNHLKTVNIDDIAYFYAEDKITFICQKKGNLIPIEYSLKRLEELLDPKYFFRINKKYIVHLEAIAEMYYVSKSKLKIKLNPLPDDLNITVAIEKIGLFKKWLAL
jgi:two-component system response regulator LytT